MFLQLLRAIQKGEFHFPTSNINRFGNLPLRLPIQGQQGLSGHFEMALTGRKKSSNVKTNGSL